MITEQKNFNVPEADGLLGIGREVNGQGGNETQFIAGLVNQTNNDLIQNFTAYIDIKSNKIHLGSPEPGSFNNTFKDFLKFENQVGKIDDGSWAVRIEDTMYGSPVNGTSLEDEYSDLAIVDTMFPGILIPNRVWGKLESNFITNVSKQFGANVICNMTETILGSQYSFCYGEGACGDKDKKLTDIFFYFNATRAQSNIMDQYILNYRPENYAVDQKLS